MSAEIELDVSLDAIRDVLELEQWPPNSGRAMCRVYIHYPKMESPAEFAEAVCVGNPGQTIAIAMETGVKVNWPDFARYSRQNNYSYNVQFMRPWLTGEDEHQDFRRMYMHAVNVLNMRELAQLGTAYSGIRMGAWSVTDPAVRTLTKVTAFSAVIGGDLENQPTLATRPVYT